MSDFDPTLDILEDEDYWDAILDGEIDDPLIDGDD